MKRSLALGMMLLMISGCATQSFVFEQNSQSVTHEHTSHFFISGLGQEKVLDPVGICGGKEKVVRVETHLSFLNGLLGFVTYGVYTPRDATVYCRD